MFKISKRFMSVIMACVMMFCATTISAKAAEIVPEESEEMEALAAVYVTENGVEVVPLATATPSYPFITDGVLNPGAGKRSITISIPSGKTVRQVFFVGGLNGGAPAGATGWLKCVAHATYWFSYGEPVLLDLIPTKNSITFTVWPEAPYNGSEYTYHYGFLLYGN